MRFDPYMGLEAVPADDIPVPEKNCGYFFLDIKDNNILKVKKDDGTVVVAQVTDEIAKKVSDEQMAKKKPSKTNG